ncbi:MAG: SPOR domain-containing protein [Candidatus Omnitrophica bacterium]|nr:SPOR domain-containing protein [Candidatus Omnitrophota bacterium]
MVKVQKSGISSGPLPGQFKRIIPVSCFLVICCLVFQSLYVHAEILTIDDVHAVFMQKDYVKTLEVAKQLSDKTQNFYERTEAYYYAGLSELWQGKYAEARAWIQKALKGPASPSLMEMAELSMIDTYYMEGDYQKTLRHSQNFLETHPKSDYLGSAYLKIARSHLKLGHWKEGREILQKILQRYPSSLERFHAEQLLAENQFFSVQVGSFQDRGAAERLVGQLQQNGEYAYIVETTSQEAKKFFRVRVGQIQQFEEAQKLESKLAKLGYPTKIYP